MKLQHLQLFNKYRSLEPFSYSFPKHTLLKHHIDPICLVGLNGSGKSNFLELIADIFYDLEIYFLHEVDNNLYGVDSPKYFAYSNRNKEPIYFDIRYKIKVWNKTKNAFESKEIQITRKRETKNKSKNRTTPEFKIKAEKQNTLFQDTYVPLPVEEARHYLPMVVGYTSGLNDLLSMPFIELQDYYAQQVAKEAKISGAKKTKKSVVKPGKIESPNFLLLNYESNSSIVIANLLLASSKKLATLKDVLRIERLNSFRIVIRWNKLYSKSKLEVTDELQKYINALSDCATIKEITKKEGGEVHTLDFVFNNVTQELFKQKFETPKKLFEALTKLNLLNTLCVQKTQRNKLRKRREKGELLKFPQIATADKIFSIEKIELVLKLSARNYVRTEYEKISDGEHQFIHIIGGILLFDEQNPERDLIYLLDEPDTHFNPLWRSDFFYQLENILENRDLEFLITTHSPFILSDCHGYNVFKFVRENEIVTFERIDTETYGSTFENILENIFHTVDDKYIHFNNQMAKLSFNRIQELNKKIEKAKDKESLEHLLGEIRLLGESIDRLNILKHYSDKEKTF